MSRDFALGLVEGFYGRSWSWGERLAMARALAQAGYKRYLYAPKSDANLRKRWREPFEKPRADAIVAFSTELTALGIEFGMGLSPCGLASESSERATRLIAGKVAELIALGASHVSLLFDDMRGDTPALAVRQLEAVAAVRARWPGLRVSFCPTYYSSDATLDRLFGARPTGYLETLGTGLDSDVEIFWTGQLICSTAYPEDHLEAVGATLRRKPLLWDNYPVNETRNA